MTEMKLKQRRQITDMKVCEVWGSTKNETQMKLLHKNGTKVTYTQ